MVVVKLCVNRGPVFIVILICACWFTQGLFRGITSSSQENINIPRSNDIYCYYIDILLKVLHLWYVFDVALSLLGSTKLKFIF